MHYTVFEKFNQICENRPVRGPILEVGAVPGCESLLRLPALRSIPSKIGLNLQGGICEEYEILAGNANAMENFQEESFALVLCNSTLEHDPRFWLTLREIRRVTQRQGWIVIGVPGYSKMLEGASTPTLGLHHYPGDYYRFSEQAVREIFLEGLEEVSVEGVLMPPRFIGAGRKP